MLPAKQSLPTKMNAGVMTMRMPDNLVEKTKFEVARSMAAQGRSLEEIFQVTGLLKAQVKQVLN